MIHNNLLHNDTTTITTTAKEALTKTTFHHDDNEENNDNDNTNNKRHDVFLEQQQQQQHSLVFLLQQLLINIMMPINDFNNIMNGNNNVLLKSRRLQQQQQNQQQEQKCDPHVVKQHYHCHYRFRFIHVQYQQHQQQQQLRWKLLWLFFVIQQFVFFYTFPRSSCTYYYCTTGFTIQQQQHHHQQSIKQHKHYYYHQQHQQKQKYDEIVYNSNHRQQNKYKINDDPFHGFSAYTHFSSRHVHSSSFNGNYDDDDDDDIYNNYEVDSAGKYMDVSRNKNEKNRDHDTTTTTSTDQQQEQQQQQMTKQTKLNRLDKERNPKNSRKTSLSETLETTTTTLNTMGNFHETKENHLNHDNQEGIIEIRLNKIFKDTHSRRGADELIKSGRITVNGMIITSETMGIKVRPYQDTITIDNKPYSGWEARFGYYLSTNNNDNNINKSLELSNAKNNPLLKKQNSSKNRNDDNTINPAPTSMTTSRTSPTTKTKTTTKNTIEQITVPEEYIKYWKPIGVTCTTDRSIPENIIDAMIQNVLDKQRMYEKRNQKDLKNNRSLDHKNEQQQSRPYKQYIQQVGTVERFLQQERRIYHVGRLDKDSSGLILLTSDGRIPNDVLRTEYQKRKTYHVTVHKNVSHQHLQQIQNGLIITTDTIRNKQHIPYTAKTLPCDAYYYYDNDPDPDTSTGGNDKQQNVETNEIYITLVEGRNRQIRIMFQTLGYTVLSLHRINFMGITLQHLSGPNDWCHLNEEYDNDDNNHDNDVEIDDNNHHKNNMNDNDNHNSRNTENNNNNNRSNELSEMSIIRNAIGRNCIRI